MRQQLLQDWTPDDFNTLEKGVLLGRHRMLETGLFSDDSLARIIDNHPDEDLSISTMGHDTKCFEWREGDRNGVAGSVIIDLVRRGHLWINCRKMMQHHPEFRELVNGVYDELQGCVPGFLADQRTANLLISSPDALVHYHIDMPVNMLWHMRGRKRVWVYPHFDHRFVSQEVVEQVCIGRFSEDVPYDPEFDRYALVFDVEPGQLLTWPQMAPHRVTNLEGLNVSLSTEHKNAIAKRRINVHLANHLLRTHLGRFHRSTEVSGIAARLKEGLARAQRIGGKLFGVEKQQFTYPHSFRVDPDSPNGYTLIEGCDEIVAPHTEASLVGR